PAAQISGMYIECAFNPPIHRATLPLAPSHHLGLGPELSIRAIHRCALCHDESGRPRNWLGQQYRKEGRARRVGKDYFSAGAGEGGFSSKSTSSESRYTATNFRVSRISRAD